MSNSLSLSPLSPLFLSYIYEIINPYIRSYNVPNRYLAKVSFPVLNKYDKILISYDDTNKLDEATRYKRMKFECKAIILKNIHITSSHR